MMTTEQQTWTDEFTGFTFDADTHTFPTGLPELTGSEKQVTWANSIRRQAIIDWQRQAQNVGRGYEPFQPAMIDAARRLADITDSRWWIEHRGGLGSTMRTGISRIARTLATPDEARADEATVVARLVAAVTADAIVAEATR